MAAVPNTGQYSWVVDPGIPSSKTYKLVIMDSADKNNFDMTSGVFEVDGALVWHIWHTSSVGPCTRSCGGGHATRTVQCQDQDGNIARDESLCSHAMPKPWTRKNCNTVSCPTCPNIPQCHNRRCPACKCVKQDGGDRSYNEEFCGWSKYDNPVGSFAAGCDVRGSEYSQCCTAQGLVCEDGCTGVAYWKRTSVGQCSKPCGGGTRKETYSCKGKECRINNPSSCKETSCMDGNCHTTNPTGSSYPCNQQPCTSFYWQVLHDKLL